MILANVAAAEELEARRQACMYRVHDAPDPEKLAALRDFLDETRHSRPGARQGAGVRSRSCSTACCAAPPATPEAALVNELVLRCQAQAVYSPNNIGHFGLALRALRPFHLADPPLRRSAGASRADRRDSRLPAAHRRASWARSASTSRRPSGAPPRPSGPRSTATARRCSPARSARCSPRGSAGSRAFGLFVTLPENGADGLVPISTLPADYYDRDERAHRLVGRRSGRVFPLGDEVAGAPGRSRRDRRPAGVPDRGSGRRPMNARRRSYRSARRSPAQCRRIARRPAIYCTERVRAAGRGVAADSPECS